MESPAQDPRVAFWRALCIERACQRQTRRPMRLFLLGCTPLANYLERPARAWRQVIADEADRAVAKLRAGEWISDDDGTVQPGPVPVWLVAMRRALVP